jgi:hypothetical protein
MLPHITWLSAVVRLLHMVVLVLKERNILSLVPTFHLQELIAGYVSMLAEMLCL